MVTKLFEAVPLKLSPVNVTEAPTAPLDGVKDVIIGIIILEVTTRVALQPVFAVYVIVEFPADKPVTTPDEFTVATANAEEIQGLEEAGDPVPDKLMVLPTATVEEPEILTAGLTVATTAVLEAVVHALLVASTKYVVVEDIDGVV